VRKVHELAGELFLEMIVMNALRFLDQPGLLYFHGRGGDYRAFAGPDHVRPQRVAAAHPNARQYTSGAGACHPSAKSEPVVSI
jgi:hypothetical protein